MGISNSPSTVQSTDAAPSMAMWPRTAVQIGLVIAAFLVLWPTTQSLRAEWADVDSATYTHGLLIVAVAVWLLWRERSSLHELRAWPSAAGGLLLLVIGFGWLVCVRAGLQTLHQMLLPLCAWLAIYAALGRAIAMRAAFPLAYLYFAIPVWGSINGVLQEATIAAVAVLLEITGVSALVTGNKVELASGTFEIVGGCSGLHFLIVALAIAALHGEIERTGVKARLQLLALAAVLALVTNWVRVYSIILVGDLTDMQHYLVRVEHYRFGWVLFALAMIIFFVAARRLPHARLPHKSKVSAVPPAASSPAALIAGLSIALLGISIGPLWNVLVPVGIAPLSTAGQVIAQEIPGWDQQDSGSMEWRPLFKGADLIDQRTYHRGGASIQVLTVSYANQRQGKELVGYHNSLAGKAAGVVSQRPLDDGVQVIEQISRVGRDRFVIWYFYVIGDARTNRPLIAQIRYGLSSLRGPSVSRLVAIRAACGESCEEARTNVQAFLSAAELDAPSRM